MDVQALLQAYDSYFDEETGVIDPSTLTDEQIDAFLGVESELGKTGDALIVAHKTIKNRIKNLEKKADLLQILLKRIMSRLNMKDRESDDGKAKLTPSHRFDVELTLLPEEYQQHWYKRAAVNKAISDWRKIPGVTVVDSYSSIRIR